MSSSPNSVQYSKDTDFSSKDQIKQTQLTELEKHLSYTRAHSPYYQRQVNNLDLSNITIEKIDQFPFTTKKAIEEANDQFEAVDREEVIEYVTTSGTLGHPISMALTQSDLDRLAYNEARSLAIAGVTKMDTVLITTTLDKRFMAGMAYYLGATQIGATVIRSGIGDLHFQLDNLQRYRPNVLIAVPSFAYKLGTFLKSQGINPSTCSINKIICIGEPIRNADLSPNSLNEKLVELWNCDLISTYASTEMATAFTECEHGKGGHILPELMMVEVVDEDGQKITDGQLGEVVATPLAITGSPLIRYKTGDMARLYTDTCPCGRNTPRLGPIEGRKKHLIKLKGTSIYPQQVENIIHQIEGIELYVLKLSLDELGMDHLHIFVSTTANDTSESIANLLAEQLRVKPEVSVVSDEYIKDMMKSQQSRKPSKLIDLRSQKTKVWQK